jgi:hypothetical protein
MKDDLDVVHCALESILVSDIPQKQSKAAISVAKFLLQSEETVFVLVEGADRMSGSQEHANERGSDRAAGSGNQNTCSGGNTIHR